MAHEKLPRSLDELSVEERIVYGVWHNALLTKLAHEGRVETLYDQDNLGDTIAAIKDLSGVRPSDPEGEAYFRHVVMMEAGATLEVFGSSN